jgi:hypothetical protein
MMGAVGQMPMLGQFPEGVIFDLPAQVSPIPDDGTVIAVQSSGHHPDPVLFFRFGFPSTPHPPALGPSFAHAHDPHRTGIGGRYFVDCNRPRSFIVPKM